MAYFFGGSVFWGAFAWAVPASLVITLISRRANLRLDTAIGIIFAGGFALHEAPAGGPLSAARTIGSVPARTAIAIFAVEFHLGIARAGSG